MTLPLVPVFRLTPNHGRLRVIQGVKSADFEEDINIFQKIGSSAFHLFSLFSTFLEHFGDNFEKSLSHPFLFP